jgi:hypothetical protein
LTPDGRPELGPFVSGEYFSERTNASGVKSILMARMCPRFHHNALEFTINLYQALKPCHAAQLGFLEIQVEAQAGDVMAETGRLAGPAPDVQHQPAGDVCRRKTKVEFFREASQRRLAFHTHKHNPDRFGHI